MARRWLPPSVSVLLHAAAAVLLWRSRTEPPKTATDTVEFELVAPAAAPPAPSPEPPPIAAGPETPARERPERPERATPDRPARRPIESPAPPAAPSLLQMRPAGAPLALAPTFDTVDRLTRDGVIAPPDPNVVLPDAKPGIPRFSDRLAALRRKDEARANVARGQVDPPMYDLLRDAQKRFAPSRLALDRDRRAPSTVGRSLKQWVGGLLRPHVDPEDQRQWSPDRQGRLAGAPDVLNRDMRAGFQAMGGYLGLARGNSGTAEPMECLVCLVVKPDHAPEVVLGESSGNAELDRAAVDALQQSAASRPLEGPVRRQKSCYRFRATVERVPPVPVLGCGFDEVTLKAGCFYPTQKVYRTSVVLESVDYGG